MRHTPSANNLQIGIFGRCNSGKSSLINALTGQQTAIVSATAGTTTDPVRKRLELPGLGAVTLTDTAGFDDAGPLGSERLTQTRRAARRTDVAVIVCDSAQAGIEKEWIAFFRKQQVQIVLVLNKCDLLEDTVSTARELERQTGIKPIQTSAASGKGISTLQQALVQAGQTAAEEIPITGSLAHQGEVVLLVMPQDAEAPKGRLILPQSQTIRELLDKQCTVVSCTAEGITAALRALAAPPALVVTDSQAFGAVNAQIPPEIPLTSFSVLFANLKGDIRAFVAGAAAIDRLTPQSRVLVAEACTHAPAGEDIGRVKIPRQLRARVGESLRIDIVAGEDFPDDLTPYQLVIHCGACMFNRRLVLSRIAQAAEQGVPITNYGVALAHLTGILPRIVYPGKQ